MEFLPLPTQSEIFLQITLAMVLGMLLGMERSIAGKTAGMRTYALVSLGSCLLVIISILISIQNLTNFNFDPLRVAAGIVTGIGFLGAGLIIMRSDRLQGLTTAAGLWVAAGIGIAVGFRLYSIAIFTTFLTLIVFTVMWFIEEKIKLLPRIRGNENPTRVEDLRNSDPTG